MDKAEFSGIMKEINIAYGNDKFPVSKEKLDVWYKYFHECERGLLAETVEKYIRSNTFPPTICDMCQIYEGMKKAVPVVETSEDYVEELVGDDW